MEHETITSAWLERHMSGEYGLQTELARYLNLHKSAVNKMLSGDRKISQEEAAKIRIFFADRPATKKVSSKRRGKALQKETKTLSRLPENVDHCISAIIREFDPDLTVLALREGEEALVREAVEIFIRLYAPDPRRAQDVAVLSELFGIEDPSSKQASA